MSRERLQENARDEMSRARRLRAISSMNSGERDVNGVMSYKSRAGESLQPRLARYGDSDTRTHRSGISVTGI
jgi:hypothetical protein